MKMFPHVFYTEKGDVTVSYLLIQKAKAADSGKYACSPSNAIAQEITVHVLNGKKVRISSFLCICVKY